MAVAFADSIAAQDAESVDQGRMKLGPVSMTPAVAFLAGYDDNIYNEEINPKEDFILAAAPQVDAWVRAGRVSFSVATVAPMAYFRKFSDESSVGIRSGVQLDVNLNHVRPYVSTAFVNSQERTSPEIDTRPRRIERNVVGGANLDLFSRLVFTVSGGYSKSAYEEDAFFEGVNLSNALNREGFTVTTALRYPVSTFTKLALIVEKLQERFEFEPTRDSDTLRILPGIELDSLALVKGRAAVGYRKFNILNSQTPEFTGLVANVDLTSSPWSTGQLAGSWRRDVNYSFDQFYPYFVLGSIGGSVTQVVHSRWRLSGHADRQQLDYRTLSDPAPPFVRPARRAPDLVYNYGGGLQFDIRSSFGIRISVDSSRRVSGLARRRYEGNRIFASVFYGS